MFPNEKRRSQASGKPRKIRGNSLILRAYHEAGHAFVARLHRRRIKFVTIEADLNGKKFGTPNRLGVTQLSKDPSIVLREKAEKIRRMLNDNEDDQQVATQYGQMTRTVRRHIQFCMGGMMAVSIYESEANLVFSRSFDYGASDDYNQALDLAARLSGGDADEASTIVQRATELTCKLLLKPRNWQAVECIANALHEQRTMTGKEIIALLKKERLWDKT